MLNENISKYVVSTNLVVKWYIPPNNKSVPAMRGKFQDEFSRSDKNSVSYNDCPQKVSVKYRFFYQIFTMIQPLVWKSDRYCKVSALENPHYSQV